MRVAKPSIEEPDAEEPARPDPWGTGVSNGPGLPDRCCAGSTCGTIGQLNPKCLKAAVMNVWSLQTRCHSAMQVKISGGDAARCGGSAVGAAISTSLTSASYAANVDAGTSIRAGPDAY